MNTRTAALLLGALLAAPAALAGPLTPPAGPVLPTHKTMSQLEPRIPVGPDTTPGDADSVYRITQPGSYYLAGNLTGASGKHGIEIATTGVALDLTGFTLFGGGDGALDAVTFTGGTPARITVRNGFVRGWGRDGINLGGQGGGVGVAVEDVHILSCGRTGIRTGDGATVRRCTVVTCDAEGIATGVRTLVEECSISDSHADAALNLGHAGTARACVIVGNQGAGVWTGDRCLVTGCTITDNQTDGAFVWGSDATVSHCVVCDNGGSGISLVTGSAAVGNTCTGNTTYNILVWGDSNRIDGNTLRGSEHGMLISGLRNLVVRNTASGNAVNYVITGGNRSGQVVNCTATATPVVIGDGASSTLSTTDPWANFAR